MVFVIKPVLTLNVDKTTASPGETITLYGRLEFPPECGDINNDGLINIRDLAYVASRFGALEGTPEYDPKADLNGDGVINIRDVIVVAFLFGKTISWWDILITEQTTGFSDWTYTGYSPIDTHKGAFYYTYTVPSDISTPTVLYFQAYFPGGTST